MDLLVKFLERLYRTLPHFCTMATSTEFIEALAATLFPPHDVMTPPAASGAGGGGRVGGREGEMDASDMIEFDDEEVQSYFINLHTHTLLFSLCNTTTTATYYVT